MPQAGLVRRDDGTLQVALQCIEKTHATKPRAGTAVRSLARCPYPADTARQVARRAIVGRDHNADAPPAWSRVRTSPEHPPPPGYRRTRAEIPGTDDSRRSPAAPPHSPARWWSPPPLRRVPTTAFPRPLRPIVVRPGCCWSCGQPRPPTGTSVRTAGSRAAGHLPTPPRCGRRASAPRAPERLLAQHAPTHSVGPSPTTRPRARLHCRR
jgi:hypothetical protein